MARREEIMRALGKLETRGKGRAYPVELREKIIEYVRERRAGGGDLKTIGSELGVAWRTLEHWTRAAKGLFRRVEVQAPPCSTFTVHGPHGVRVDGLDLDELTELLRRLA